MIIRRGADILLTQIFDQGFFNADPHPGNLFVLPNIIAALIIGSALIVISKTPPLFYGISLIGIIGFLAAAVLGIWLLVAIVKKGRL